MSRSSNSLKTIISGLFTFIVLAVQGQDAAADFRAMNRALLLPEHFSIRLEYRFYTSAAAQLPYEVMHGHFIRSGKETYFELGKVTTLQTHEHTVSVDRNDSLIVLADPKTIDTAGFLNLDYEKILKTARVSYTAGEKARRYTLEYTAPFPFSRIELVMNSKTFIIEKITLFYRDAVGYDEVPAEAAMPPRVEIIYSKPSTRAEDPSYFDHTKFISGTRDYRLAAEFKGFKLINQKL